MPRGNGDRSQTVKATLGLRARLDGEFAPGERVPEVDLAARLGVSRTPMRLAPDAAHEAYWSRWPAALRRPLFTRDDVIDAIELRGVLRGRPRASPRSASNPDDELALARGRRGDGRRRPRPFR
jgi:GntR family transcriptional regulator of vanillate catabolism